jgi:hypothetical protein
MMTKPEAHSVRDGATREIRFTGVLLAEVSSRHNAGPRWTELRLFRTEAGSYVLEKVGVSVVVHTPGCPNILGNLPRFQEAHPGADPADGNWWFCEVCGDQAVRGDITRLLVETNRYWATIAEDPALIVDALYRRKNGARSMMRVSLDLLNEASKADPKIADVYQAEFVL